MEVHILGAHNIETRETRLTSLLIDGVLAIDAGGLTSALSLPQQEKIKAILLSHHHFDHTRDLVTVGFNAALWQGCIEVYASRRTLDVLIPCLLDGKIYANLLEYPNKERPSLLLKTIEPHRRETIGGYEVLALPVKHNVPTVGYQVTSQDGKSLFYTSDTGPGLSHCWQHVSPHVLITETCGPNEFTGELARAGHLSPQLLGEELSQFHKLKGYLPRVIVIHIAPPYEQRVREEVAQVAEELGADISLGYEDMKVTL
jgi:ribonuclease BN (tRNA processing enzyme)